MVSPCIIAKYMFRSGFSIKLRPINMTIHMANSFTTTTENAGQDSSDELKLPEEPINCCMSGCANCVWIVYAEELSRLYKDGGIKAKETIMSKVTDPSMKMFLLMELKALEKENKVS